MARIVHDDKDNFYVHLISNAQPELFKNKANHFQCQFSTPLDFPSAENWEVALKEYHYVNNVDTIVRDMILSTGRLTPLAGIKALRDDMKYPMYFTEYGSKLSYFNPMIAPHHPYEKPADASEDVKIVQLLDNYLQKQRLLTALRLKLKHRSGCPPSTPDEEECVEYRLSLRNTTEAVKRLYPDATYGLLLSYPLALAMKSSSQILWNQSQEHGLWTDENDGVLGDHRFFNEFTMANNYFYKNYLAKEWKRHAIHVMSGFQGTSLSDEDLHKINQVQTLLETQPLISMNDYWFCFLPKHRMKCTRLDLPSKDLTYFNLFRRLEEMNFGTLHVNPAQTSIEFRMKDVHADLGDSTPFAVELPINQFFNVMSVGRARIDKWVITENHGRKVLKRKVYQMTKEAFTVSLHYSTDLPFSTKKLEKLFQVPIDRQRDSTEKIRKWMDDVLLEMKKIKQLREVFTARLLDQRKQTHFFLTSKMILRVTLNTSKRAKLSTKDLMQIDNAPLYTPYEYSIYDLKVPETDAPTRLIAYTNALHLGQYDIMDELYFKDIYSPLMKIRIPRGFYTPKTLTETLQHSLTTYSNDGNRISLINQNLDDAHQGFLQIRTNPYTYLQFDSLSQNLFQLPRPFITPNTIFTTPKPFALTPESYNILIYCDIVDETVVGGEREKILSVSPVFHSDYQYGRWVGKEFSDADYYPVAMKQVQKIEIQFRGDTGEYVPISEGRSYVKLHFRRRPQHQTTG